MKRILKYFKELLSHSVFCRFVYYKIKYPATQIHPTAGLLAHGGELILKKKNSIGKNSLLILAQQSRIQLGEDVWLGQNTYIEPLKNCTISVNDKSSVQDGCRLIGEVHIGRNVLLAPNVFISSGNHFFSIKPHFPIRFQDLLVDTDPQYEALRNKPVIIEDDCWIGTNVVIVQGVKVGRGSIIGANSVVTADVAPYTIVAGSPARLLKKRLEYLPPSRIIAEEELHIPYFYAGCILQQDEEQINIRLDKLFTINLKKENVKDEYLYVVITAEHEYNELYLHHRTDSRKVKKGKHPYIFPVGDINNIEPIYFNFYFSGPDIALDWENKSVLIHEAGVK